MSTEEPKSKDPQERIADALERIATALEHVQSFDGGTIDVRILGIVETCKG